MGGGGEGGAEFLRKYPISHDGVGPANDDEFPDRFLMIEFCCLEVEGLLHSGGYRSGGHPTVKDTCQGSFYG